MEEIENVNYEIRVIAYIDILGFQDLIEKESCKDILKSIKGLHQIKENKILSEYFRTDLEKRLYESIDKQITFFSDTIVISFLKTNLKDDYLDLSSLFSMMNSIQDSMILFHNKLIRGSITEGLLYHRNNVCFGPALIKAYKLESQKAIYPRVIIDNCIFDNSNYGLKEFSHNISFKDGEYYVDFFKLYSTSLMSEIFIIDSASMWRVYQIQKVIKNGLNSNIESVHNKYVWMAKQFNEAIKPSLIKGNKLTFSNLEIDLILF